MLSRVATSGRRLLRLWGWLPLLTSSAATAAGQAAPPSPGSAVYPRARISLHNAVRIEATDLVVDGDELRFVNRATGAAGRQPLAGVFAIQSRTGTKAMPYAVYGGVGAGVSAALALLSFQGDGYLEAPPTVPFVGAFALVGALAGALIGSSQETWETIYAADRAAGLVGVRPHLEADAGRTLVGLSLPVPLGR